MTVLHKNISSVLSEHFDFSELPDTEAQKTKTEMHELLLQNTLLRVLENADDTARDDFNSFLEINSDPMIIMNYMNDHLPDFKNTLDQELQFLINQEV
ncbi:MAG: hypothetical protein ACPGTS_01175 [Minisyncoccia bacterium]